VRGRVIKTQPEAEAMKRRELGRKDRGLIRALDHRGARAQKAAPFLRASTKEPHDPTFCPGCGATYRRKVWRVLPLPQVEALFYAHDAAFDTCPACTQVRCGRSIGRVVLRGDYVAAHQEELRRRIGNVARRAAFTQPEHRLITLARAGGGLEVRVTSQKLAHRLAHELEKAFHGRAGYAWSEDDGGLIAVWER
jgi:hypothetical protein